MSVIKVRSYNGGTDIVDKCSTCWASSNTSVVSKVSCLDWASVIAPVSEVE